MQQKILTRSLGVALAALLAVALPASTVEPGENDAGSPPVDLLQSDGMTREELAGLYQALAAGGFEPPPCEPGEEMFDDVPASDLFCPWIEELARRGVATGCDADNYCPGSPVTRAQMAAFIVRTVVRAGNLGPPIFVAGAVVTLEPGTVAIATASCPPGSKLLSGGGLVGGGAPPPHTALTSSSPDKGGNRWRVRGRNDGETETILQAVVRCLEE